MWWGGGRGSGFYREGEKSSLTIVVPFLPQLSCHMLMHVRTCMYGQYITGFHTEVGVPWDPPPSPPEFHEIN